MRHLREATRGPCFLDRGTEDRQGYVAGEDAEEEQQVNHALRLYKKRLVTSELIDPPTPLLCFVFLFIWNAKH